MPELLRKLFYMLNSNRGETLNGEETPPEGTSPEGTPSEGTPSEGTPPIEQTIDWEGESNPYKKRYSDSQGQIQPLVRALSQLGEYDHDSKSWKPKTQAPQPVSPDGDVEKLLEGYDPEFKKAFSVYTQKQIDAAITKYRDESTAVSDFNSGIQESRTKAIAEFGDEYDYVKDGKFNTNSPLYKMANEILSSKYTDFNPDGTFHKYRSSDAEYRATVEAYAIISKKANKEQPSKGHLSAIQGKGTRAAGVKKVLSLEEYSNLSSDEKDAYDLAQIA